MVDPVLRSHALNCLLNDKAEFDIYRGNYKWGLIYRFISIYYSSSSSMLSLNNNSFGMVDIYYRSGCGQGLKSKTTITSDELEKDTEFYDALFKRRNVMLARIEDEILSNSARSKP